MVISGLLFVSFLIYLVRLIFASAHDREREKTLLREVRRGRRALQILAAECCTAYSPADAPYTNMAHQFLNHDNVYFPQRSWRGEDNTRLSQLARPLRVTAEGHLDLLFTALLRKLALPLSRLPADKPVMVLLEHSSSIPEETALALFWQAWHKSGIRQSGTCLNGSGAQVIDNWLDHNIRSEAVLLVVSWQYVPDETHLSAEAVSGVLFGNRLTQNTLLPLAFLHRPEAAGETFEELHYSISQALDWVPVKADKPEHIWLGGVTAEKSEYSALMKAIDASALTSVDQLTGFHNMNDFLGDPRKTAVWLAVAVATQLIQQQPAYHLLINREQQNGKFWSLVVSPVIPAKEG